MSKEKRKRKIKALEECLGRLVVAVEANKKDRTDDTGSALLQAKHLLIFKFEKFPLEYRGQG